VELPADAQSPSGLYKKHKLFSPRHPEFQVDPGRLAFGQERMLASPLQMAMVAATVANHGVLMQPHLLQQVVSPDGKTVHKVKPEKVRRVISRKTADALTQMMRSVVTGGTATNLASSGLDLAGKTGTAEIGVNGKYVTWFIAFAPASDPKVAVAVALENQTGFGATTAGPIAKAIVQAVLPQRSNNGTSR
jgi:peptidoglycan glycosyltransferase